jgi:hypothetical protein
MKKFIFLPFIFLAACNTLTKDEPLIDQLAQDATQEVVTDVIAGMSKKVSSKTVKPANPVSVNGSTGPAAK